MARASGDKGLFGLLLLALAALLVAARPVDACERPYTDGTVLGKFEEARVVLVVKVISVGKALEVETTSDGKEASKQAKIVVEKVYKGDLKVGDEMIFGQGESGSCFLTFDGNDVGTKFLLYLTPR